MALENNRWKLEDKEDFLDKSVRKAATFWKFLDKFSLENIFSSKHTIDKIKSSQQQLFESTSKNLSKIIDIDELNTSNEIFQQYNFTEQELQYIKDVTILLIVDSKNMVELANKIPATEITSNKWKVISDIVFPMVLSYKQKQMREFHGLE